MPYKDPAKKREHDRKYAKEHPEYGRRAAKRYRLRLKERAKQGDKHAILMLERYKDYRKRYRQKNRDKFREYQHRYYLRHQEIILKKSREYYRTYKDLHFKRVMDWRKRHPEIVSEIYRRYRLNHRDKVNIKNLNRVCLLKKVGGKITIQQWEELKKQYNYTCPNCGRKEPEIKLTIDHIVPISQGGKNTIDNIQPLCKECNSKKLTKIIKYAPVL
jgi:5-methylcytosine-specific restriction endonuclease McrA